MRVDLTACSLATLPPTASDFQLGRRHKAQHTATAHKQPPGRTQQYHQHQHQQAAPPASSIICQSSAHTQWPAYICLSCCSQAHTPLQAGPAQHPLPSWQQGPAPQRRGSNSSSRRTMQRRTDFVISGNAAAKITHRACARPTIITAAEWQLQSMSDCQQTDANVHANAASCGTAKQVASIS